MPTSKDLNLIILNFSEEHLMRFPVYIVQIPPIFLIDSQEIHKATEEEYQNHKTQILTALKEIETDGREKLVIFPELTMIPELIPVIEKYAMLHRVYIIAGSFYEENRNICSIITPFHATFHQEKIHRSKYELVEKLETNNEILIFQNTIIGNFAVVICIDYTDIKILASLRGLIDYLIVVACNPSDILFDILSKANVASLVSYIIYVNATKPKGSKIPKHKFGRSGIYGPFKSESIQLKTHFEPQLIFTTLDLQILEQQGEKTCVGTFDIYKNDHELQELKDQIVYERSLNNGIEKAIEIINKEITLKNYFEALTIAKNFAVKLEEIDIKKSIDFFMVVAVLFFHTKKKGKFLAIINKIKQLKIKTDLKLIDLCSNLLFLNNFFPNEIEIILNSYIN